jgi:hypothetical protein
MWEYSIKGQKKRFMKTHEPFPRSKTQNKIGITIKLFLKTTQCKKIFSIKKIFSENYPALMYKPFSEKKGSQHKRIWQGFC